MRHAGRRTGDFTDAVLTTRPYVRSIGKIPTTTDPDDSEEV
jgi:hypothetical protein